MPFYSNKEARERPPGYQPASVDEKGVTTGPRCCDTKMKDVGGCSEGCCDDYRCETCGYKVRIEWPD